MSNKPNPDLIPDLVPVRSEAMTHVLHAEGLELVGGRVTYIPLNHLARVLELQGVSRVLPPTETPEEI